MWWLIAERGNPSFLGSAAKAAMSRGGFECQQRFERGHSRPFAMTQFHRLLSFLKWRSS